MKHDIDREMRLVEVVIFREKLASSAVALAEDYLAANLSKSPKLHSKELATAACYAGEPLPLQVRNNTMNSPVVVTMPAHAFAAGCMQDGVAHVTAGCKYDDDDTIGCWSRSYDVTSGKLLDIKYITLG